MRGRKDLADRMIRRAPFNRVMVDEVRVMADEVPDPPAADLLGRLERARQLAPPAGIACRDCWLHGRDGAIQAARAGGPEAAGLAEPAAKEYQHDRKLWNAGRDAVLECLTAG